jgi:hypothetical protein
MAVKQIGRTTWLSDPSPQASAKPPAHLTETVLGKAIETRPTMRRTLRLLSESLQLHGNPLLFCDIDGVISLWGFAADSRPAGVWTSVDGIPHFLSTRAAEHLQGLCDHFELVWCTGWEEKADEHLPALLGVPNGRPHLTFAGHDRAEVSARAHWKLDAVDAHAGDRPLAWIDDAFNDACHAWAARRAAPTLLVPTEPHTGLGDAEAAALHAFAQRVTAERG